MYLLLKQLNIFLTSIIGVGEYLNLKIITTQVNRNFFKYILITLKSNLFVNNKIELKGMRLTNLKIHIFFFYKVHDKVTKKPAVGMGKL